MTRAEIVQKAKALGIKVSRLKKEELIRAIQVAEGNFPCFGTAREYCDQQDCLWRKDCMGLDDA
ncbi:hypothetical protein JW921_03355 [Candidatus Fermentibacterales bacterium]|nr:hypothetical protein [Candidatus Fermentibacterales bacterium]